jgi:hypothetical protein
MFLSDSEFVNIEACGTYSYHCALKGKILLTRELHVVSSYFERIRSKNSVFSTLKEIYFENPSESSLPFYNNNKMFMCLGRYPASENKDISSTCLFMAHLTHIVSFLLAIINRVQSLSSL